MGTSDRMERCKEVFSLLSEYLNLELPPDACENVRRHIEGREPCIEFAESLRKTVELCRRYEPGEMPEPLSRASRQELLDAYQKRRSGQ